MPDVTKEKLLEALDCVTWYNGLAEIVISWEQLPVDEFCNCIKAPDIVWKNEQLQVIWMIAVWLFGNYGTSPRGGWIEKKNVEDFRRFCREITKTEREAAADNERLGICF